MPAESVFSHMEDVWSDKRNRLSLAMVKSEPQERLNFKLSCTEFKTFIEEQKPLIAPNPNPSCMIMLFQCLIETY